MLKLFGWTLSSEKSGAEAVPNMSIKTKNPAIRPTCLFDRCTTKRQNSLTCDGVRQSPT